MTAIKRIILILLLGNVTAVAGDLSAESIAVAIANDTGKPVSNYLEYASKLQVTLSLLSQEQLATIFEGVPVTIYTGEPGNEPSGEGDPGSKPTPNSSNGDPALDGPLIDLIHKDPGLPPGILKNRLLAASPLSEAVLAELIGAGQDLPAEIMLNVLTENAPLPESLFVKLLNGTTNLSVEQLASLHELQYQ